MKFRGWVILFLVVLWIPLYTAVQYSHNFHHEPHMLRLHTACGIMIRCKQPDIILSSRLCHKAAVWINLSVVHTKFTGMYKIFLNRNGGTWLRFLEEKRALSFLSHVQVGAHPSSNGYQCFLSSGKMLQWRKAERLSSFNFEIKNVWSCTSTLSDVLNMRCFIKHTNAAVYFSNDKFEFVLCLIILQDLFELLSNLYFSLFYSLFAK